MKITKCGTYKLTEDLPVRNSIMVGVLAKGSIINITQIDEEYNKVSAVELLDWHYNDIPCVPFTFQI